MTKAKDFTMKGAKYQTLAMGKEQRKTWIDRTMEKGKKHPGPSDCKVDYVKVLGKLSRHMSARSLRH